MFQREDHYSILNTRFIRIITWHQSFPHCQLPWVPQLHSFIFYNMHRKVKKLCSPKILTW